MHQRKSKTIFRFRKPRIFPALLSGFDYWTTFLLSNEQLRNTKATGELKLDWKSGGRKERKICVSSAIRIEVVVQGMG